MHIQLQIDRNFSKHLIHRCCLALDTRHKPARKMLGDKYR